MPSATIAVPTRIRRRTIVLAILIITVPWVAVAWKLHDSKPIAVPGQQPTSIVWANRVFTSAHDLKVWLASRGASYPAWAAAHPNQAAILEPTGARRTHRAGDAVAGGTVATTTSSAAPRHHRSWSRTLVTVAVDGAGLLVALALLALALSPGRFLALVRPEWEELSVEARVSAFAGALSVAAGVFVGRFIG